MAISVAKYKYYSSLLNGGSVRVVQISDLHNKCFKNGLLDRRLIELEPDIILISGDFLDRHARQLPFEQTESHRVMECCASLCATFCAEGNHEWALRDITKWRQAAAQVGVTVLDNAFCDIIIKGQPLRIAGITEKSTALDIARLQSSERLTLTLAHRPERILDYEQANCALVFCGHAHGGLVRIFGRGLYAPEQGILPRYTMGMYKSGSTAMVVSAGLGRARIYPRIFNPPQLVLLELVSNEDALKS